jgi:hypothetical protein
MNLRRIPLLFLIASFSLSAQTVRNPPPPQPVPMPPPIAAPVDQPYAGPIQLDVDLTSVRNRVAHVREKIPVQAKAKEIVLLYPQWIPGAHSPVGPISRIAGIVTSVDGTRVQWIRDQINVYAFHVPLAAGARTVDLQFDYATSRSTSPSNSRRAGSMRPRWRPRPTKTPW